MIPIQETFLHYLWQFQQFDSTELLTAQGEELQLIQTGRLNTHAGPDFTEARLIIGGIEWAGNVEMHLKSSDWQAHAHSEDGAYDNVILHVVWEHNQAIFRPDGTEISTLVLQPRTSIFLLAKYRKTLENQDVIPCASQFAEVTDLTKFSMFDRTLLQRVESKAAFVNDLLSTNQGNWEETTYQLLAKNFGFKINAEPFLRLAQQLPLKILQKHRDQPVQLEALVFGMAGFLEDTPADAYQATLQKEFQFLAAKYQLKDKVMAQHQWKLLRLRPANFPTVRLAQFAQLIASQSSLFSLFIQTETMLELIGKLKVKQPIYWQKHHLFGKETQGKMLGLGKESIQNILINTVVPLLAAYSQQKDNRLYLEKAISYLEQLPSENNHITLLWENLGVKVKTAFDSQAVIELYNHFCSHKQCLKCNIGIAMLK